MSVSGFWITNWAGIGVSTGAHRLWAHKSFYAEWPLKMFLLIGQLISGQVRLFFLALSSTKVDQFFLSLLRTVYIFGVETIECIINIQIQMLILTIASEVIFSREYFSLKIKFEIDNETVFCMILIDQSRRLALEKEAS